MQHAKANRSAYNAFDDLGVFGRQCSDHGNHGTDDGQRIVYRGQENATDIDAQSIHAVLHLLNGNCRIERVIGKLLLDGACGPGTLCHLGKIGLQSVKILQQRCYGTLRFGSEQTRNHIALLGGVNFGYGTQNAFNSSGRVRLHALAQLIDIKLQFLESPGFRWTAFGQRFHEALDACGRHIGRHIHACQRGSHGRNFPGGLSCNSTQRRHCSNHGCNFFLQIITAQGVDLLGKLLDFRLRKAERRPPFGHHFARLGPCLTESNAHFHRIACKAFQLLTRHAGFGAHCHDGGNSIGGFRELFAQVQNIGAHLLELLRCLKSHDLFHIGHGCFKTDCCLYSGNQGARKGVPLDYTCKVDVSQTGPFEPGSERIDILAHVSQSRRQLIDAFEKRFKLEWICHHSPCRI